MILGAIDLLIGSIPIAGSIIGVYLKMNNLIIRQDIKIQTLQEEIKEIKRNNERQEEKISSKLEEIDNKLTNFMLHFGKCQNYKTARNYE